MVYFKYGNSIGINFNSYHFLQSYANSKCLALTFVSLFRLRLGERNGVLFHFAEFFSKNVVHTVMLFKAKQEHSVHCQKHKKLNHQKNVFDIGAIYSHAKRK